MIKPRVHGGHAPGPYDRLVETYAALGEVPPEEFFTEIFMRLA